MGAVAGLIGLPGTGRTIAVADDGAGERVGGRDARRPACADGCKICTTRATRTIGRKFFSCRCIANPSASDLNHHESPKSRSGSGTMLPFQGEKPAKNDAFCSLRGALPRYQASGYCN